MGRFEAHSHTMYSNLRILDSINRPKDLINYAQEIGLTGIAITDHESLSSFVEIDKIQQELLEKGSSFKIARGDEIYLTDTRDKGQKYWHFILIAKDATGCKALRELSSIAWINSYFDKGLERVPTLKSDLEKIIEKYGKGHLILSTACLGSELDNLILEMDKAEKKHRVQDRKFYYKKIVDFIQWCNSLADDDFYLEIQPAQTEEQIIVNKKMKQIAKAMNKKIIVTTDAHYLKEEDREVHKAFLNSKEAEREVDSFYKYAYLQTTEEIIANLEGTGLDYYELEKNTNEIYDKIETYTLHRNQKIPEVEVPIYPKESKESHFYNVNKYPTLDYLMHSDNVQERYWINYCQESLNKKNLNNEEYLSRLEEEADTKKVIGEKLGTCMFAYPIFLQHYIDLFWECGSCVGAGRGCFLPDKNYITMANGKTKLIEDVQIGDYVKTIDGTSKKVINTLSYDCNEEIYKISVNGNGGFDLYNTNNHQYWAMKNKECPYDREYCSTTCGRREKCPHKQEYNKEWIRADALKTGDYVFYPWHQFTNQKVYKFDLAEYCIEKKSHFTVYDNSIYNRTSQKTFCRYVNINEEFLYFIGVCVGDGWTTIESGGKVGIAFNSSTKKDLESLERCETFLCSLGLQTGRIKHKQKDLIQLYCYNLPFALLIRKLVGHGVENKQISDSLLYDNKEHMTALLTGLLASDGSYDKNSPRFSFDGINFNLVNQVKMLCSYLHFYTSIITRKAHGNNKESYKIRACGGEIKEFLEEFSPYKYKKIKSTVNDVILDNDGYWIKIIEIEKMKYNGKVYDLTVENNHNYIVNNVTVHNSAGSGLNHYLLGIVQTDPIKTNAPWFRYMNKDRIEIGDIDTDLDPTKRELIFEKIREERGQLGCVQVCTFGTASTKSAIQISCRGLGINNDIAQYISSLVPSERGFLWTLKDTVYGNKEKDRKPNKLFIKEVEKYPNLLKVAMSIEGLVISRSIHASGVNFYDDDPYETACFMKATNGSIITQYSLHDCEFCGDVKQDFLVTQQMTIMGQCIKLLQDHGYFEKELTLRQAYDKYVHPDKLPLNDKKLWNAIDNANILALFQLNSNVGSNVVKQLLPRNVEELTACNALMRLTGEKGAERPADRYERLKKHPEEWQKEMNDWGFSKHEQQVLRKYMGADYGAPSSQEVLMLILMDPETCGFTLAESNKARKTIAKKLVDEVPKLKEKILKQAKNPKMGEYIWEYVIMPQASYSFSRIHGFSYSLIACQAAFLATYYPSVYWNTAYLRAISGIDNDESSNYKKIAEGVCDIKQHGIEVSLIDINKSEYMFEPDEENNRIIYGLKAVTGINGETIQKIVENRPYTSLQDFLKRTPLNKTAMISLIKAGAFDQFDERKNIMREYIWSVCEPKKRLTLQNFNALIEANLIPQEINFQKRVFVFNKALKANCKFEDYYSLKSDNYYKFYTKFFDVDLLEPLGNKVGIKQKTWKKLYDEAMKPAKEYLKNHQDELLDKLNNSIFDTIWNKYAQGNYSSWEMDSLGMYYHKHELSGVDNKIYEIESFKNLPTSPEVETTFKRKGAEIPIYKLYRIAGTVIAKDDMHSSISILTVDSGVVTVKMNRDYYAMYNRRISEVQKDGTKKVIEQGWFSKGTLVVLQGVRRGDSFFLKNYKRSAYHQLYKITEIHSNGTVEMTNERVNNEKI